MPLGRSYNFQRYRWLLKCFSVFKEPRCPLPCTKNPPCPVESVSTPYYIIISFETQVNHVDRNNYKYYIRFVIVLIFYMLCPERPRPIF